MTKHGEQLKCDTEGCNATTRLDQEAKHLVWYFDYSDGKFMDYCPKHHKEIRRNPPR